MEELGSRCLKIGKLVALAEMSMPVEESAQNHLDDCATCGDLNAALRAFLKTSLLESGLPAPSSCPNSDTDCVAQFLAFLQPKVSEDATADFFRHFNDCYSCSEQFVGNWNAYLATKKNMGAS